jgi:hypothetical protein
MEGSTSYGNNSLSLPTGIPPMLALGSQALARIAIACTAVLQHERAKWLRRLARQCDPSRQSRYNDRRRSGGVLKMK